MDAVDAVMALKALAILAALVWIGRGARRKSTDKADG